MWKLEKRWADAVLSGFAPSDAQGLSPGADEVRFDTAFETAVGACTRRAALGLRIAVWLVAWSPLWLGVRWGSMRSLVPSERATVLERLLAHRVFFVRELTTLLKVVASLALLGTPTLRARSQFDATDHDLEDAALVERTGERVRRRLPLADGESVDARAEKEEVA